MSHLDSCCHPLLPVVAINSWSFPAPDHHGPSVAAWWFPEFGDVCYYYSQWVPHMSVHPMFHGTSTGSSAADWKVHLALQYYMCHPEPVIAHMSIAHLAHPTTFMSFHSWSMFDFFLLAMQDHPQYHLWQHNAEAHAFLVTAGLSLWSCCHSRCVVSFEAKYAQGHGTASQVQLTYMVQMVGIFQLVCSTHIQQISSVDSEAGQIY